MRFFILINIFFIGNLQGSDALLELFPGEAERDILGALISGITPPDMSSDLCLEPMADFEGAGSSADHHFLPTAPEGSVSAVQECEFTAFLDNLAPQEQKGVSCITAVGQNRSVPATRKSVPKKAIKKRESSSYTHITNNSIYKAILEEVCEKYPNMTNKEMSEYLEEKGIIINISALGKYRGKKKKSSSYTHVTKNPVQRAILEEVCEKYPNMTNKEMSKYLEKKGIIINASGLSNYRQVKKKESTRYTHIIENPDHNLILKDICEKNPDITPEALSKELSKKSIMLSIGAAENYLINHKPPRRPLIFDTENKTDAVTYSHATENSTNYQIKHKQPPRLLTADNEKKTGVVTYRYAIESVTKYLDTQKQRQGVKRLRENRGDPSTGPNRKYRRLREQ